MRAKDKTEQLLEQRNRELREALAVLQERQARLEMAYTGKGYNLELPALHADGSPMWVNSRAEVVRDSEGSIVGLRGTVQNITERKQSASVAKNERFIRTITDAMPAMAESDTGT